MKGKMIVYRPGQLAPEVTEKNAPVGHLDVQAALGGPLESVPGFENYGGEKCVAFCHEEGKLEKLATNNIATALWADAMALPLQTLLRADCITGPLVIFTGDDEFLESL